jgi:hypothetical protein
MPAISQKAYQTLLTRVRNAESEVKELRVLRDQAIVQHQREVEQATKDGRRAGLKQAIDHLAEAVQDFRELGEALPIEFIGDKFKYASWTEAFTQVKYKLQEQLSELRGPHWEARYVSKATPNTEQNNDTE